MAELLIRKGTIALAPGAPTTFDPERRTVELTWTTGAAVERNGRRPDGSYGPWIEELGTAPNEVDLSRLNAGAPLLNAHSSWDLRDVIGVVERAHMSGGQGHATVRFSDRAEVASIVRDVAGGILRNVSVGYRVLTWREVSQPNTELRRFRAISWEPAELSLVPIPADVGTQTRSQPNHREGIGMDLPTAAPAAPAAVQTVADPTAVERERASGITLVARKLKLGQEFAEHHIAVGTPLEKVRELAYDLVATRQEATPTHSQLFDPGTGFEVRGGYDASEPGGRAAAMAEG
ncbi:MAG: hypothetical protein WAS21_09245, partial [Geminicoccaceae bacterium]